jgi:enoyl-CoA hydratase/carnithine racemase
MPAFETLLYEEINGVAWVTLNRPDVHNAFNAKMQHELYDLWRGLRRNDDVRAIVLTGAGEKAFCTGIDRTETMGESGRRVNASSVGLDAVHVRRFRFAHRSKSCDLWKPVIAAVNGMACGGAFYMLGEVEFIIAAENATFFDPHVTYGMTASFEPMHMLQKMPFHEIMRLSLLGNYERLSAKRAHEVGLVSEVVAADQLLASARWAAEAIASQPALAIQGTVRALWTARELTRSQALSLGYAFVSMGTNRDSIREGQEAFAAGKRVKWRLR